MTCIHQNSFIGKWQKLNSNKFRNEKKEDSIDPDYWKVPVVKEEFRNDGMQALGKYYQESIFFSWLCFLLEKFHSQARFLPGGGCWEFEAGIIEMPDLSNKNTGGSDWNLR